MIVGWKAFFCDTREIVMNPMSWVESDDIEAPGDDDWVEMTQLGDQWAWIANIVYIIFLQIDDDVNQNNTKIWEDILV